MKAEILVADDDRTVRRGVSGILADAGYAVREAKNGAEALRLFGESRPDLVLLDVMMPKSDGFAVCAAIRETDPSVPVLFLSALGDEESQLKGFGYGADEQQNDHDRARTPGQRKVAADLHINKAAASKQANRNGKHGGQKSSGQKARHVIAQIHRNIDKADNDIDHCNGNGRHETERTEPSIAFVLYF